MRTVELKPSAPTIRSESKEFKEFGVEEEEVEEEEVLSTGVLYDTESLVTFLTCAPFTIFALERLEAICEA